MQKSVLVVTWTFSRVRLIVLTVHIKATLVMAFLIIIICGLKLHIELPGPVYF